MRHDLALIRKGHELDAVFDLSPGGIVVFNDDDCLTRINKPMNEWLLAAGIQLIEGVSRDDFWRVVRQNSCADSAGHLQRHVEPGEGAIDFGIEGRLTLKFREKIISDDHGASYSRVIYFTDITQEFTLDQSKSNFLATAAHELRTPLSVILGFAELLTTDDFPMEQRRELSGSIFKHSLHLRELLGDLLDLAKIEAEGAGHFRFEECRVSDWLIQVLTSLTTQRDGLLIYGGRELNVRVPQALTDLHANIDPSKLQRVLQNLLSNAHKYSPEGSAIDVVLEACPGEDEGKFALSVIDRGVGMSTQQLKMAFKRFWRADSNTGHIPGTGLGLAICKEIVDFHGGVIRINSRPGQGTQVSVVLSINPKQNLPVLAVKPMIEAVKT